MQVSGSILNRRELPRKPFPRCFFLDRKPRSAGQKVSLSLAPRPPAPGRAALPARSAHSSPLFRFRCSPAAMAAAAAAGGPGVPLSPDELLPKGDAEKTEEELEEEDDEEVLGPCGVGRGARLRAGSGPPGGVSPACCGLRTEARRGARRGRGGGVFTRRRV